MTITGVAIVAFGINQAMQAIMHWYPPLWNHVQQSTLKSWPNVVPAPEQLIEMLHKKEISETEFFDWMSEHGYSDTQADRMHQITFSLLNGFDYINLNRREMMDDDTMYENLHKLRFNDEQIKSMQDASLYFPNAPDLVRFAVREVYSPDLVEEFGLLKDLPNKFLLEAKKAGLPEEQAKNFWAAHWELPSILRGYEMLHRGVINEEQLKSLMKAKDIMPNWRDKLIKISYNPLTRVDVRRMYGMGVLDETQVHQAYLNIGYSPEDAAQMTEFTVIQQDDELNGITRSSVIKSFKDGILNELEFKSFLNDLGYSQTVIDFHVNNTNYEIQKEFLDKFIKEVKSQYMAGMKTLDEVKTLLHSRAVPPQLIERIDSELKLLQSQKVKLPGRSQLESWVKNNIIDEEKFNIEMKKLGYTKNHILNYLSEVNLEIDTSKAIPLKDEIYLRWAVAKLISKQEYIDIMLSKGKKLKDINILIEEAGIK